MKKQIIYTGLAFLLAFGTTSCEDWLDLRPENEILLEDFWKSKTDVEQVLASCYKSFTARASIERMIVWGELRSDNMVQGREFPTDKDMYQMRAILNGELTAQNVYAQWASFYSTINICNTLIHYAPEVRGLDDNFTETDLNLVLGEAKTLRALAYFYLVRAYREVPLVTEASIDDTQDYSLPKEDEQTLLDFIISELEYVKNNNHVRESYGTSSYNKGRITKSGLNALLADVYLWNGDYDKCIEAGNEVLADNNLKLVNDAESFYLQLFYIKNSTESIFELQFQNETNENAALFDLYGSLSVPSGYLQFSTALAYDEYRSYTGAYSPFNYRVNNNLNESEDDVRAYSFVRNEDGGKYGINKYVGAMVSLDSRTGGPIYAYGYGTSNWIIYRLADVILMKAEALAQKDRLQEAVQCVNITYLRSNADADSLEIENYATKLDVENLVLRERQRELLFEGKRWFDLVRLSKRDGNVARLNSYVQIKQETSTAPLGAATLDAMYMPVSRRELNVNKKLVQNPYYEESATSER